VPRQHSVRLKQARAVFMTGSKGHSHGSRQVILVVWRIPSTRALSKEGPKIAWRSMGLHKTQLRPSCRQRESGLRAEQTSKNPSSMQPASFGLS
jgi:hypothetical protein